MTELTEIILKDGTKYVTKGYEREGAIISFRPFGRRNIIRLNIHSVESIELKEQTKKYKTLKFDEKCELIKPKGNNFENSDLNELF